MRERERERDANEHLRKLFEANEEEKQKCVNDNQIARVRVCFQIPLK